MKHILILMCVFIVTACTTASKPPTVNGKDKQAINTLPQIIPVIENKQVSNAQTSSVVVKEPITVYFAFNSADFKPTAEQVKKLQDLIKTANHIEVRGSSDGVGPIEANERIALERALAAKKYLIEHEANKNIISVSFVHPTVEFSNQDYKYRQVKID